MNRHGSALFMLCLITVMSMPVKTTAAEESRLILFEDLFDGQYYTRPANWFDDTAYIIYDGTPGRAAVKLQDGRTWGGVNSIHMPMNLSVYNKLQVTVGYIHGCTLLVQLFHYPDMNYFPDPAVHSEIRIWVSGNYIFDIPTLTGEDGVQDYGIRLSVEGMSGGYAALDEVRIFGADHRTPTSTVTPTPAATSLTPLDTATISPSPTPSPTALDTRTLTSTRTVTLTVTVTPTRAILPDETWNLIGDALIR